MKKKQIQTGVMDSIDFGLSIGYFKKQDTYITYNSDSPISFHDFKRRYSEYCR